VPVEGPRLTAASLWLVRTVLSFVGKRIAIDRHESINKNGKPDIFYAENSTIMKLNGFFYDSLRLFELGVLGIKIPCERYI
jgi:hypothetical protein